MDLEVYGEGLTVDRRPFDGCCKCTSCVPLAVRRNPFLA